ncbi:MAG TPA: pantetheine-phosphate adenylyltransferase [bacterium]|nr:pantetheine-phosphate adenylyltransferase [bacterium]
MTKSAANDRLGIYPGTFDPITNGHLDLIDRALHLFDRLLIAVAINPNKSPLFSGAERVKLIRESLPFLKAQDWAERVEVVEFEGLTAYLATDRKALSIIRGLRAVSDFEFEFQIALTNRSLAPTVETVFLMPNAKYTYLSSAIIKDVARHGGDVAAFVPPPVLTALRNRFARH